MERMNKEIKERVMDFVDKSNSNEYETRWNEEGYKHVKKSEIKKGKKSKAKGAKFELKVRDDLEKQGWIVDKWTNNIDLETGKIITAKKNWKFNPFRKAMMPSAQGTGFPDFISIKNISDGIYHVEGVEAKVNGILSKEEKEKCARYLQKKVFSKIWIASAIKTSKKIEIKYEDFFEKYGNKYNNV